MRNVGMIDRILRFLLGLTLLTVGLFIMHGIQGNLLGIFVAICAILPFYMALTARCFVFRWLNIHSLSNKECETLGNPIKNVNNNT